MDVPVDRYVYFATEDAGVDVPIVNKKRMCRNGCCTTCAVKVLEGKVRIFEVVVGAPDSVVYGICTVCRERCVSMSEYVLNRTW